MLIWTHILCSYTDLTELDRSKFEVIVFSSKKDKENANQKGISKDKSSEGKVERRDMSHMVDR